VADGAPLLWWNHETSIHSGQRNSDAIRQAVRATVGDLVGQQSGDGVRTAEPFVGGAWSAQGRPDSPMPECFSNNTRPVRSGGRMRSALQVRRFLVIPLSGQQRGQGVRKFGGQEFADAAAQVGGDPPA
jgi:hypothetical protein